MLLPWSADLTLWVGCKNCNLSQKQLDYFHMVIGHLSVIIDHHTFPVLACPVPWWFIMFSRTFPNLWQVKKSHVLFIENENLVQEEKILPFAVEQFKELHGKVLSGNAPSFIIPLVPLSTFLPVGKADFWSSGFMMKFSGFQNTAQGSHKFFFLLRPSWKWAYQQSPENLDLLTIKLVSLPPNVWLFPLSVFLCPAWQSLKLNARQGNLPGGRMMISWPLNDG